jgi:hypothetical protein
MSGQSHSALRVFLGVLLARLIFIDVVWTIAQISGGRVAQAGLGGVLLTIICMLSIAFFRNRPH